MVLVGPKTIPGPALAERISTLSGFTAPVPSNVMKALPLVCNAIVSAVTSTSPPVFVIVLKDPMAGGYAAPLMVETLVIAAAPAVSNAIVPALYMSVTTPPPIDEMLIAPLPRHATRAPPCVILVPPPPGGG